MIAGARVEVAPYKRDPADFVLWKPSGPELPGWDSPWGRGRPGWHIECSAMAERHLGETIDIHGGGNDLIFPHHENEVAQSTCAHGGKLFARFWLHNGMLTVDGEKMSKSLGNFFTIRDVLAQAPGEAIRFYLLGTHYRQPIDWTRDGLQGARQTVDRFYLALRRLAAVPASDAPPPDALLAALEDDLNTPQAIAELHGLLARLNKAETSTEQAALKGQLRAAGRLMGLFQAEPEAWFAWTPPLAPVLDEAVIGERIAARNAARKAKDFATADRIRDELQAQGVTIEDGPARHDVAPFRLSARTRRGRIGMSRQVACWAIVVLGLVVASPARAETPFERGAHLLGSIVACGNCHTMQGKSAPMPGRELAGGTRFEERPSRPMRRISRRIARPASATGPTPRSSRRSAKAAVRTAA